MTAWLVVAAILLAGGVLPAVWLSSRGRPVDRLVGLELAATSTVLALLALGQAYGPSSVVILPLTLVVLSFAGTLVFLRLLASR